MRARTAILACLLLLFAGGTHAQERPAPKAETRASLEQRMAEYRRKLKEYETAREKFEGAARPYWGEIEAKRKARRAKLARGERPDLADYVLTQPPKYAGPARPLDPSSPTKDQADVEPIPVVADFLRHAKEQFGFVPERAQSELAYKRAYAQVASAAGITGEQAVRIFAFEAGGNGRYDVQAGLETERPGARAISTALGYNQLLTANSVSLLAERGDQLIKVMQAKIAAAEGGAREGLQRKLDVLRRMIAAARSVPSDWSEHVKLGRTPKGLGMHALNLDIDVGPLLQTQKLLDSIVYARRKGIARTLTAAELEMMNLTGDGNGFDMLSMPQDMRAQVPTANFFQRRGYERNPIAARTQFVDKLIAGTDAAMDREVQKQGAKDLAAVFEQNRLRAGADAQRQR